MAILQRQLFTMYPFLDVEGNTVAPPSSPVPVDQLVAIDSLCTSLVGFIPPSFSKGSQIVGFLPHSHFQLLLLVAHDTCFGVDALQLGCWSHHLPLPGISLLAPITSACE